MVKKKASGGRVPGRASGPSQSRVDDGGGSRYVSRKSDQPLGFFLSRRIYRWRGGVRRWARSQGRGRAILWCCWPLVPLRLSFGLRLMSGKIGGSAFVLSNFDNISHVAFLKHKNCRKQGTGTMACY
jgi:hypothetical protein